MNLTGFKQMMDNDPKFKPAMVSRAMPMNIQKILRAVKYVGDNLLKLIDYNKTRENYSVDRALYEPKLFNDRCEFLCNFLRGHGIEPVPGVPPKKCGTEGCAYFYDDKVLKCTLGQDEWEVATLVKGGPLFPVIDTAVEPASKVYLILSWKLDMSQCILLEREINESIGYVRHWFNYQKIEYWTGTAAELEKFLDVREFAKVKGGAKGYDLAAKIFEIVVAVFRRSDRFISSDIHTSNMGFTKEGEPQIFDFGYPSRLGQANTRSTLAPF